MVNHLATATRAALSENIQCSHAHTTKLSAKTILRFAENMRARKKQGFHDLAAAWYVILRIEGQQSLCSKSEAYARLKAILMASLSAMQQWLHQYLSRMAHPAAETASIVAGKHRGPTLFLLAQCGILPGDPEYQKALAPLAPEQFDANQLVENCRSYIKSKGK